MLIQTLEMINTDEEDTLKDGLDQKLGYLIQMVSQAMNAKVLEVN